MYSSAHSLMQRVYTPLNALEEHAEHLQAQSLSDLIGGDSAAAVQRSNNLAFTLGSLHLDLSKQRISPKKSTRLSDVLRCTWRRVGLLMPRRLREWKQRSLFVSTSVPA